MSVYETKIIMFKTRLKPTSTIEQETINRFGESMDTIGYRTFLQYIEANDLDGLRTLLDTHHPPIDDRDENGTTVLMVASGKGLTSFVREFLARGADVQAEDYDNWSALLFATKAGHKDVVQILVEHGADIEHKDMGGWTALMWGSYRGHTEIVTYLLDKGADVNVHGNYYVGPLIWAAGRGHKDIVEILVQRGAKVNVGDKYGTTALIWACRKGNAEIVKILLRAGANVDTVGMNSWTPLLVAVSGGFVDCVPLLLEKKPNVNALDKDRMTALSVACREGYQEIAVSLMNHNAYINTQDRAGDTPLIHAIKGGHRGVVEALLKKHADLDIPGKDRKTALYTAVEKGHTSIVRLLLQSNPDMESATKDGDTPLLRAVRNRNLEIVQMLLDRKAKVTAADKRGDTCLHIAMRARSKAIVEALLRNPKHSQLLYKANKAGETPYAIDTSHQKTILGQVFGARKLNANEDSEGMLGYELYSSAIADVLSEPTLNTPITVGLYAKWGSGKSFILSKLRDEMNNFACQWAEPPINVKWLLFLVCVHLALIFGTIIGLSTWSTIWGVLSALIFLLIVYVALTVIKIVSKKYDVNWVYKIHHGLIKRMGRLRLILQVAFCHPPGAPGDPQSKPVRFHFAEANSASATGEGAVGHMLVHLFEAIESHYGWCATRLYRAFRPKSLKTSSTWKSRRMCCVPIVILFEIGLLTTLTGICLLIVLFVYSSEVEKQTMMVSLYVVGAILIATVCSNLHVWAKAIGALFISQGRHLRRSLKSNESTPLTALGAEVELMTDMVKCLDAFTCQQSRLVCVIDALDSCDTERILSVLNALQTLLLSPNRPFVLLIAVDPHVIAKTAEANSRRLFTEGGIGGHDFLRNLVHLPVYLQNSGLRKVQRARMTAHAFKRNYSEFHLDEIATNYVATASSRRLSNASEIMSSQEKLKVPGSASRAGSKKARLSESVASSVGSNLHRLGQSQGVCDFTKIILTDDYFSDVNPRSMRRLMNVIYITVRLLKAFQIDFNWHRLSSWINLIEQWPVRASLIVSEHEKSEDQMEDTVSLQAVYEKVRNKISYLKESASLLDLDRDERKLDAFLQLHVSDLQVADLKVFLPFAINLDPYLRKVLKEDLQTFEDEGGLALQNKLPRQTAVLRYASSSPPVQPLSQPQHFPVGYLPSSTVPYPVINYSVQQNLQSESSVELSSTPIHSEILPPNDIEKINLSKLSVDDIINLLGKVEDLKPIVGRVSPILRENAINGKVLKYCNLAELKDVLNLNFGHWELFRLLITSLRHHDKRKDRKKLESSTVTDGNEPTTSTNNNNLLVTNLPSSSLKKNTTHLEKQVTLEEQTIVNALQCLNEEAYEDVAVNADRQVVNPDMELTMSNSSPSSSIKYDSILKHTGSVKNTDKRVSIKKDNNNTGISNLHFEYIYEKRKKANSFSDSRPSSMIITHQNNDRPPTHSKLIRSTSIDYDDIESQSSSTIIKNQDLDDDEFSPLVFQIGNKKI